MTISKLGRRIPSYREEKKKQTHKKKNRKLTCFFFSLMRCSGAKEKIQINADKSFGKTYRVDYEHMPFLLKIRKRHDKSTNNCDDY